MLCDFANHFPQYYADHISESGCFHPEIHRDEAELPALLADLTSDNPCANVIKIQAPQIAWTYTTQHIYLWTAASGAGDMWTGQCFALRYDTRHALALAQAGDSEVVACETRLARQHMLHSRDSGFQCGGQSSTCKRHSHVHFHVQVTVQVHYCIVNL